MLRAFCAPRPGSCQRRGAPVHPSTAPRQAPSLYREGATGRASASTLNPDTLQAGTNEAGRSWALGAPPAEGAVPRARCKDPESCKSCCGLSCSQNWAPSFRAGPPPRLQPGLRLPPTLSEGPCPEPQGQSRSPRLLTGLSQSEAPNLCWIPGWGSRGALGRSRAPVPAPQALESSGVSWPSGRARAKLLSSRRRPPPP